MGDRINMNGKTESEGGQKNEGKAEMEEETKRTNIERNSERIKE